MVPSNLREAKAEALMMKAHDLDPLQLYDKRAQVRLGDLRQTMTPTIRAFAVGVKCSIQ